MEKFEISVSYKNEITCYRNGVFSATAQRPADGCLCRLTVSSKEANERRLVALKSLIGA